ncbi:MAG: lytic transglycosylase domain-containing protein [Porticoccaceae bacterium]
MIEFIELAKTCAPDVHVTTIAAIVRHESSFNPLAIGVNGKPGRSIFPKSRQEAIEEVRKLQAKGASFDAGYGQINNANWKWLGITPENVFDPCTNLKAAQRVLVQCYEGASKTHQGQAALHAALSCYNTGNYTYGLKNGYVRKVLAGAGLKVPALTNAPSTVSPNTKPQPAAPELTTNSRPQTGDAFSQPRPDAFSQPRPDAFQSAQPIRRSVGSILINTNHVR